MNVFVGILLSCINITTTLVFSSMPWLRDDGSTMPAHALLLSVQRPDCPTTMEQALGLSALHHVAISSPTCSSVMIMIISTYWISTTCQGPCWLRAFQMMLFRLFQITQRGWRAQIQPQVCPTPRGYVLQMVTVGSPLPSIPLTLRQLAQDGHDLLHRNAAPWPTIPLLIPHLLSSQLQNCFL